MRRSHECLQEVSNPPIPPSAGPTNHRKSTHVVDYLLAHLVVRAGQLLSRLPLKRPPASVMFGLVALLAAFAFGRYTSRHTAEAEDVSAEEPPSKAVAARGTGVPFPNAPAASSPLVELPVSEDLPAPPVAQTRPRFSIPPKPGLIPPAARPTPTVLTATAKAASAATVTTAPPRIPIPDGCAGGLPLASSKDVLLARDRFDAGIPVRFRNNMSQAAYVELFDPQTGERSSSAVVLAGATISLPLVGDAALANVSTGTQWCSSFAGWVDPKITRIRPAVVAANGAMRMDIAIQSSSSSGWPITLKVDHVLPQKLALQPSQSDKVLASMPQDLRYAQRIIPGVTPNFREVWHQNDSIAGVGRTYASSMHGGSLQDQNRYLPNMEYTAMPTAEWKLSRNGALDYVGGRVGSTPIQFVVDLRSPMSAIPTSLARQLGITECAAGHWFINGLYRSACAAQVQSMEVGGTELHNVWITYGSDIVHPVLGRNILGLARYKRNTDGLYLAVGPRTQ